MDSSIQLGIDNPADLFARFKEAGDQELLKIRAAVASPDELKQPRHWGIQEAAQLIGRSVPWLRDNDKDCPQIRGRRVYTLDRINDIRDAIGTRYKRPEGSTAIIMAVTNFKGGVGKTTTVVHLAQKAAIDGLRVLVVDFDTQATCTFSLGNLIPDVELEDKDICTEAMLSDPDEFKYIIKQTYFPCVHLAPTNLGLQDLELSLPRAELNNEDRLGPPAERLMQCLTPIREMYDLILIDCPPNMGALTTNALVAANALLIPVPPKEYDRASFVMFTSALAAVYSHLDRPLDYLRILPTLHEGTNASLEQEAKIRELYGSFVLLNNMYRTTELEKATKIQSSIYDLEKPVSNKKTYQRALDHFDAVNNEIIGNLKTLWEVNANG